MNREDVIISDFQSEPRVVQSCKFHGYSGIGSKKKPEYGCEICNFITMFTILARHTDKQHRLDKAKLDEFEACIHAICELEDEGAFDFKVTTPEITIHKDAVED